METRALMLYYVLLSLLVLEVGCSDSNFGETPKSTKSHLGFEQGSDDAAPTEKNIDIDTAASSKGEDVAIPEMIAGAYLIFCTQTPLLPNQVNCRLEKEGEATKFDLPDLRWELRTREGNPLASTEFKIRMMDQSSAWHTEIEFITDKEVIISATSPHFSGDSLNKLLPYVRKSPSSTDVVEEILPTKELPTKGFAELFSSPTPSATLWSVLPNGLILDFSAGTMKCSVPAGITSFSWMTTKNSYDFTNGTLELDFLNLNDPGRVMQVFWNIRSSENHMLFYIEKGQFVASLSDPILGGMVWGLKSYDPLIDRHIRIQHDASNKWFTFQTSADGNTWTILNTFPITWSVASVQFEIQCGTEQATAASSAEIDNFIFKSP